jgi:hypothetical protein
VSKSLVIDLLVEKGRKNILDCARQMSAVPESSNSPGGSPFAKSHPLYSIGYGDRTLDQLIAVLQSHQIEYVIDVRSAPYSKFKPEFSRQTLELALKNRGLRYVFMGDLLGGQPKDTDCYVHGKVDYDKLQTKPFFHAGIQRLKTAYAQQIRAALMCSEGRPEQCHRSKLIGEALLALDVPLCHIDEQGQLLTQPEVIKRLTGGQMDLFGQTFTSRNRYPAERDASGWRLGGKDDNT